MKENHWLNKSLELLRKACSPFGITASLSEIDNYGAVFCRDAVMAGIVGLLAKDEKIIEGLKSSLLTFQGLQEAQGQIASNYTIVNGEVSKVSFGTLSPKIDACTWYLIGTALLIKEKKVTRETFEHSILKTIDLLEGLEYNGGHLMYIPKGGNWADEYVYDGYVLYDQALRAWALALLAPLFEKPKWAEKSESILKRLNQEFKKETDSHYNSSIFPGGKFSKFDLAAHAIMGIVSDKKSPRLNEAYRWLEETFLAKELLPPAFHPAIKEGDVEWENLSNYYLYRFKNKPHHFHNGGIWWIWLGWLSVALSYKTDTKAKDQLLSAAFSYLDSLENFEFEEYVSGDDLRPNGTKQLCFTAAGIAMLSLTSQSFDFSMLKPSTMTLIKEPLQLRSQYFQVSSAILQKMSEKLSLKKEKLVVSVCGESGSGKSITALCLQKEFEQLGLNAIILHQDSYFHYTPKENHEKRLADINWVGPQEVNMEKMQQHICDFQSGKTFITVPVVDYEKNEFTEYESVIHDNTILIVEGVYAFLLQNVDYKVYMARTYKDTIEKRKQRSREAYSPFVEEVLAIEQGVILPLKPQADVVVGVDYTVE